MFNSIPGVPRDAVGFISDIDIVDVGPQSSAVIVVYT
jgi:hypothetical protein